MKWLIQNPRSAAEFLRIPEDPILESLDVQHIQQDRTTFIQPDFAHIESDIVLQVPFLRDKLAIIIYILIEHQSEPDPFMILRLLDYISAIYKRQRRLWVDAHNSMAGFLLQPVLPIVFYTGTKRWDSLPAFRDLEQGGKLFKPFLPNFKPLFLSLKDTPGAKLTARGGFWVRYSACCNCVEKIPPRSSKYSTNVCANWKKCRRTNGSAGWNS